MYVTRPFPDHIFVDINGLIASITDFAMERSGIEKNPWDADAPDIAPLKQALALAQRTGHIRWVHLFNYFWCVLSVCRCETCTESVSLVKVVYQSNISILCHFTALCNASIVFDTSM